MANSLPTLSPTFNDDNPFPSTPAITDDDIRARVFTYACLKHDDGIFEDRSGDPSPDNEKYEFLGNTVLGLVVTDLLLDMYPNLHVGSYTKIRALIIGNSILAAIFDRCTFLEYLKHHTAQEIPAEATPKIQAEVFQSYVGGLYLNQGFTAVEKWLKTLFKPYITEAYIYVRTQRGPTSLPLLVSPQVAASPVSPTSAAHSSTPSTGYLAFFNEHLQKKHREGKFHDGCAIEKTFLVWTARVEVDGEVLGCGKGGTKKAARNEAAKEALEHMGIAL